MKMKLRGVSLDDEVTNLENELSDKNRLLEELSAEAESLVQVKRRQKKAIKEKELEETDEVAEKTQKLLAQKKQEF